MFHQVPNIKLSQASSSGTTVNSLLDSPPCSSSSTCYALTTPVVLHSTKGLLTLSSGAFKATDNTYLAKSINLNNWFVPSANIALNAIGYFNQSVNAYTPTTVGYYSYMEGVFYEDSFKWQRTSGDYNWRLYWGSPSSKYNGYISYIKGVITTDFVQVGEFFYKRISMGNNYDYGIARFKLVQ